jgi:hypothetical protein
MSPFAYGNLTRWGPTLILSLYLGPSPCPADWRKKSEQSEKKDQKTAVLSTTNSLSKPFLFPRKYLRQPHLVKRIRLNGLIFSSYILDLFDHSSLPLPPHRPPVYFVHLCIASYRARYPP